MNAVFAVIFLTSAAATLIISPDGFLTALMGGAEKALKTALTLFCIYAVFMGLSRVAEACGLTSKAAKGLKKPVKKLFGTDSDRAAENISLNLACNLLGIGGAATPFAVKAVRELEKEGNGFAQKLLFVINATSVQIVPTTVIALRAAQGSISAADIFLPSLICTAASTLSAVLMYFVFCGKRDLKRNTYPKKGS